MAGVTWKLEKCLEEHGLTRYQLARAMGGNERSRLTTLYRMRSPKRIDLAVLADILSALEWLTGSPMSVSDLLEYSPSPPEPRLDYLALAGLIDDPDSPGDVSARVDDYLGHGLEQEHRALQDER
jgi:hypothetical protein